MSLIDRVGNIRDPENPELLQRIPRELLIVGFRGLALGEFSVAQFKNYLNLDAAESAEVDYLVTKYNAQPNASAKAAMIDYLELLFAYCELRVPGYTTRNQLQAKIDAL